MTSKRVAESGARAVVIWGEVSQSELWGLTLRGQISSVSFWTYAVHGQLSATEGERKWDKLIRVEKRND
jgi:hypothetical protein